MSIPYFSLVKPHLIDALALPDGPAFIIINQLYITQFTGEDFKHDPIERLEFCRINLPRFSRFVKLVRHCRNLLMHNDFFPEDLWLKIYAQVQLQALKPGNIGMMFDFLWQRLQFIQIIIKTGQVENHCPRCHQLLPEIVKNSSDDGPEYIEISLLELRERYREEAKFLPVKILGGKYKDQSAIFKSWCGTSCYMMISGQRVTISLKNKVEVDLNELKRLAKH